MDTQKLYSLVRQAIEKYNMIDEGDRVAVGISGGKDSLTLLCALAGIRKFYPKKFELCAVTIDLGFGEMDFAKVKKFCDELGTGYIIEKTQIADILEASDDGKAYCSLCARLRRGAITNVCLENGINKLAYAHHMDDVAETAFMSLTNEGRFTSFWPVTKFDVKAGCSLSVIRPMIYVTEAQVRGYAIKNDLPVVKNVCKYDDNSNRSSTKKLITDLSKDYPDIRRKILHALEQTEDWINCSKYD